MIERCLFFGALFMLASCGGEGRMSYVFVVDSTAMIDELKATADAAAVWNTCGVVNIVVKSGAADTEKGEVPVTFNAAYIADIDNGVTTLKYDHTAREIRIRPGLRFMLQETIEHEFGHAIDATKDSPNLIDDEGHVSRGVMMTGYHGIGTFSQYECGNLRKSRGW